MRRIEPLMGVFVFLGLFPVFGGGEQDAEAPETSRPETNSAAVETGVSQTETEEYSEAVLFKAARDGNIDLVAELLHKGDDPAEKNVYGELPLHVAAANGHVAVAALLTLEQAWVEQPDDFGLNPVERAEENGITDFEQNYISLMDGAIRLREEEKGNGERFDLLLSFLAYATIPALEREIGESWTSFIARDTVARLKQWLSLSDIVFPEKISEPNTPLPVELNQEEWETNSEFEQRVAEAQQERQVEVAELLNIYRTQVEERNREVVVLHEIQSERMIRLTKYRSAFARLAMEKLFTDVEIENMTLDEDSGDLYLSGVRSGEEDLGSFVVKNSERNIRQAAFDRPEDISAEVKLFADESGNFGVVGISLSYGDESHVALPSESVEGDQFLLTASVEMEADFLVPQEQALSFIDRNAVGEITYKDGSKALTGFDDDLAPRIDRLPSAAADMSKWALVIGAEEYLNTDDIIYARRSAELFALTVTKVFGVPESHLVTLYDSEATGENIKEKISEILDERIAEGDTLYFYYNGHGMPNPDRGADPLLLPTDMNQDYIGDEPFFDLRNLYRMFQESKAGKVLAFMDSCFTGKTDGRSVFLGQVPTRLIPSRVDVPQRSTLTIISAGTETQFSSAWPQKGHRLFSYHLINALADGEKTVAELYKKVAKRVEETSLSMDTTLSAQRPVLQGNGGIEL